MHWWRKVCNYLFLEIWKMFKRKKLLPQLIFNFSTADAQHIIDVAQCDLIGSLLYRERSQV